jgi:hypothetical protein
VTVSSDTQAISVPSGRGLGFPAFSIGCALLLLWGWSARQEVYFTPRFGSGYALGILGTALMLLLLLYSLRKRVRRTGSWGPLRHWFRVHMVLGVLGPVATLLHANFQLGSLNSTVALACVLLVASSGIVGRFIYPKIHHGLFGRRVTLRELQRVAESERNALGAALSISPRLAEELEAFETTALRGGRSHLSAAWTAFRLGRRAKAFLRLSQRILSLWAPGSNSMETERALRAYLAAVRKVAVFRAYERLFSLWHAFHLPLCIMLFAAAFVHVVAVHMY